MLSSKGAQSLKSYGHFSDLGVGSLSVTAMLYFSGKANTSIHGLREDVTARYTSDAAMTNESDHAAIHDDAWGKRYCVPAYQMV